MRKTLLLLVSLSSLALLVGCGGDAKTPVPTPTPTPTPSPTPAETSRFVFIRQAEGAGVVASNSGIRVPERRRTPRYPRQRNATGRRVSTTTAGPAFISEGSDSIIAMMNDGTQETVISDQGGQFYSVQLSPDGSMAVFTAVTDDDSVQVFTQDMANLDSEPVQLTTDAEDHWYAQFSRDGSQILFNTWPSGASGRARVSVMSVEGGAENMVASSETVDVSFPTFTPDGRIVFADYGACRTIDIMNADGTGMTILSNEECEFQDATPSVSADGNTIVFSRSGAGAVSDIYRMDIDGGNVRLLKANGWDPRFVNGRIVYITSRDGGHGEVYSMNPDGSDDQRLTTNTVPEYFIWD